MANADHVQVLIDAASQSNLTQVTELLGNGTDVNADVNGITPLVAACMPSQPNMELVALLLRAGANPNAHAAVLPLHHAALRKNAELAELLLANGADPNRNSEDGQTPLHKAANGYNDILVRVLLDRGADPNVTDLRGRTPLLIAIEEGNEDAVDVLQPLTQQGDVERPWRSASSQASNEAKLVEAAAHGDAEFVRQMLESGVSPESRNEEGVFALHAAAEGGQTELVGLLLEKGADPELRNGIGATPLIAAASYGRADVVRMLLERGASATAQDDAGQTGIFANMGSHVFLSPEVVSLLIQWGCDPSLRDHAFRMTPKEMLAQRHEADPDVVLAIRELLP